MNYCWKKLRFKASISILIWTAILALTTLFCNSVYAGYRGECKEPFIFHGSAANLILLPYTYTTEQDRVLGDAAQNISSLIQFDVLNNARYGSLGVPVLAGKHEYCDTDTVLEIIKQGSQETGGGIATLWGRFFETGGTLYIQSYFRFYREGAEELISLSFKNNSDTFKFSGRLPFKGIAFSPRKVLRDQLEVINKRFSEDIVIRKEKNADAKSMEVNFFDRKGATPVAFRVESAGDGWMKLDPFTDLPSGYIRVGGETSAFLKHILPELFFVDGIIGYLTFRVKNESGDKFDFYTPRNTIQMISESMMLYRKSVISKLEPMATALSYIIPAITKLLSITYGWDPENKEIETAQSYLEEAVKLTPNNADVLNLSAITRIYNCCSVQFESSEILKVDQELARALVADPHNRYVISNLREFYRFLERRAYPSSPIPINTVRKRLSTLNRFSDSSSIY